MPLPVSPTKSPNQKLIVSRVQKAVLPQRFGLVVSRALEKAKDAKTSPAKM